MTEDLLTHSDSESPAERTVHLQEALAEATPIAFVTPALVAINVAVFLVMVIRGVPFLQPAAQQVLPWGANFGPLTTGGQWWRLLTACFLHFGVLHIGVNMYILYQVGIFTEKLFGNLRYLVLYLIAGICGNIAGLFFHPFSIGAGASGAVFGVYGGLLGFLVFERGVVPARAARGIIQSAVIFIIYNIVAGYARPETDQVAHIGGIVAGFIAGCALARPLAPARQHLGIPRALMVAALATACCIFAIHRLPPEPAGQRNWNATIFTRPSVLIGTRDRVVYTGEATAQDARRMGQALTSLGILKSQGGVVLLDRNPAGASLTYPLSDEDVTQPSSSTAKPTDGKASNAAPTAVITDPAKFPPLAAAGPQLATAAGGPPFTVRLLNSKDEVRAELSFRAGEIVFGQNDRIAYTGAVTVAQATQFGEALRAAHFFSDHGVLLLLVRPAPGQPAEVSIFVKPDTGNDAAAVDTLSTIFRSAAPSLGGPPVLLHLLDPRGQLQKTVTLQ